ncbi:putative ileal sodium/bile acid cotransporter [Apostichopus japonicus]|uniref:Putative ileal sodium/bile acid cotransporter n=1 Tax=Stichopus japonicus TaxID=307972 RepID=A0A2G8KJ53_STIJA|nr:putative ileal sodium/bile acid cotransporter [Apostichopus japonicus]
MSSDEDGDPFGVSYNEMRTVTQRIHVIAQVTTLFAVGCRLLPRNFYGLEKGFCIGLFLQSLILPAIGCLIAIAFELTTLDALSMIATAAAPVASYVSVLTYWAGGNAALSVLLTAMSTTLSIGLLPLWFFVYSSVWTNSVFITASPEDVAMYLSIIILPMGCGMIVRALVPKAAKYLAKVRTICYVTIQCRGLERQVKSPEIIMSPGTLLAIFISS